MSVVDPRTDIAHDIEFGQVYSDSRTDALLQLVYLDRNVYVAQDKQSGGHRFGPREEFDKNVRAGRFSLKPEENPFANTGVLDRVKSLKQEYESQDGYKASHKAEALQEALDILTDLGSDEAMEPVPFEDLDNIGATAADNLREHGFKTCNDIRQAEDDELLNVSWVGEKGVSSIREWCK